MKRRAFLKLNIAVPVLCILPVKVKASILQQASHIKPKPEDILKTWSKIFGISRIPNETDDHLRKRVINKCNEFDKSAGR